MTALAAQGIEEMGLRKWSLPVIYALYLGQTRFSEVRKFLPGLTPRALALTLKGLQQIELVTRHVSAGYPPTSYYRLTRRGQVLSILLKDLPG